MAKMGKMGNSTVIETPDARPAVATIDKHTEQSAGQLNDQSSDSALTQKQKRQGYMAKARAARIAKLEAEKTCGAVVKIPDGWAGIPEPPPGLLPDDPVYRTVWAKLVREAQSDPQLALSLVNNAKLREQAEAEQALKARESSEIPPYLREHPPIVAVALERTDSTLATIVHRGDNGYPMTDLESAVYRWIMAGRSGNARMSGARADAIADCLIGMDAGDVEPGTAGAAEPIEPGKGGAGEPGGTDGGEGISGGLPETPASGVEEEREMGASSSPQVPLPESVPPLPEPESREKNTEQKSNSDTAHPKQKKKKSKKTPKPADSTSSAQVDVDKHSVMPKTLQDAPQSILSTGMPQRTDTGPKRAKSPLDDFPK